MRLLETYLVLILDFPEIKAKVKVFSKKTGAVIIQCFCCGSG